MPMPPGSEPGVVSCWADRGPVARPARDRAGEARDRAAEEALPGSAALVRDRDALTAPALMAGSAVARARLESLPNSSSPIACPALPAASRTQLAGEAWASAPAGESAMGEDLAEA